MNKILLLLCLSLSIKITKAQKMGNGYVIDLKNDTLYGSFNLNRVKGTSLYKPFNWGMFALSVTINLKDGTEKEYFPKDIVGFDFDFQNVNYKFRSLNIGTEALQSFFSNNAPTEVFAQMHLEGDPISFYRFRFNASLFHRYSGKSSTNLNYYYNFYAKTPKGLVKLQRTFKSDELFTVLREDLKLEEAFIETVPTKYRIDEIQEVIESYNGWKKSKKS